MVHACEEGDQFTVHISGPRILPTDVQITAPVSLYTGIFFARVEGYGAWFFAPRTFAPARVLFVWL